MRLSSLSNSIGMSNLYLNQITNEMNKSAKRISSGKKLSQDLIGNYTKLSNLKGHRTTVRVDTENLQSAKNFANVKDGAIAQITDLAQKINQSYQATDVDQDAIDTYAEEINSILENTEYNGNKVFQKDAIAFGTSMSLNASTLVDDSGSALDFSDSAKASASLTKILSEAGVNGAQMNAIDSRISINTVMEENLNNSISQIEDVDLTEENMKYQELSAKQIIAANMMSMMQSQQSSLMNFLI
jgi:flagellin-like hook-associated protein FlgL